LPQFALGREAAKFAGELSALLNCTVCDGIRLSAVITNPGRAVIGYRIDKFELDPTHGIPITLGWKQPTGYLSVSFRLSTDAEGHYLMVQSSFMGLFLDEPLDRPIMHYDYERDKGDGYPEAHLQVCAESSAWDELSQLARGDQRPLQRLHFPVGGRRFRPTLEDLIDFLLAEGIAEQRPGAEAAITEGREKFHRLQLRAMIRRNPDSAVSALRDLGKLPS
jgi:hypothetical protein